MWLLSGEDRLRSIASMERRLELGRIKAPPQLSLCVQLREASDDKVDAHLH